MNKNRQYDIIVIGGGASGMMAGICAAKLGKNVLILEKNQVLGNKLSITGGGRCNITNIEQDSRIFLSNYGKDSKYLHSAFAIFDNNDTIEFFKQYGMDIVTEARGRCFPVTQSAPSVRDLMVKLLHTHNVDYKLGEAVTKINIENDTKKIKNIITKSGTYTATNYILATGGQSHPETGSTGDGFKWLTDLGHSVKNPTPSIVPLATKEKWQHVLSGIDLSFMKITFYLDGKKSFTKKGKILFTHFGLSSPLILNSASKVAELLHAGTVTAGIDMYPDTDFADLDKKIIAIFNDNKNKLFKNVIDLCVPAGMAKGIELISPIDLHTQVNSIKSEDRKEFVKLLKALPLTITGLMGFERAVIADGGIPLSEVDTKTMKSKVVDNLYVTGDLLHVNRPSGGYSLQLCWTTGYIAGVNA